MSEGVMDVMRARMAEGDELTLPVALRNAMGVRPGDTVVVEVHGDELRIRSDLAALRRLQDRLSARAPKDHYVSDELIADRRAEANRA